jgi:shikimate dehydrogenase
LAVRPEDFATVLMALRKAGFRGVNATVPHKEAAFALADVCDPAARAAGAANLLVFREDGLIEGRNTDAVGLRESLREELGGDTLRGGSAVLLGAGGAARGAVLALADLGIGRIHILNRHAERARMLVGQLACVVQSELTPGDLSDWQAVAADAVLVVNATSAGMNGKNPLMLDLGVLQSDTAVCDIVYNPLETELLRRARERGLVCLDGLGMLMHQAVPSFEAFFGVKPEVSPGLRAVLERTLNHG